MAEGKRMGPVPDSENGAIAMLVEMQELMAGGMCSEDMMKEQLRKRLEHALDTPELQARVASLLASMKSPVTPRLTLV